MNNEMIDIKATKIKKGLTRVEVSTSKGTLCGILKLSKSYDVAVPYLITSRGKKHREYQTLVDKCHTKNKLKKTPKNT